ncbi:hypothetical protein ABDI30_02820 [Paenibacillus cisolokensis]|uniref:tetratricopeptide repeat protein n=1 Tax=Paenibacillus cisolokensis TaxID=1658519 RepID=UPI003D2C3A7B
MSDHDELAKYRRKNLKLIHFSKDDQSFVESEKPMETFADVGGLEEVKKKIRMNFILPLQQPEIFAAYGKQAGGSLLLFGPPIRTGLSMKRCRKRSESIPMSLIIIICKRICLTRKGSSSKRKPHYYRRLKSIRKHRLYLAVLSYTEALLIHFEESVRLEKIALEHNMESSEVYFFLGLASGQRGDYKLKETYMRNAVRLEPDNKQYQEEFLDALQHNELLFKIILWPVKFLRKLKHWQVLIAWIVAMLFLRPLLILFIVLYVLSYWVTKATVHVKVFGWGRRRV